MEQNYSAASNFNLSHDFKLKKKTQLSIPINQLDYWIRWESDACGQNEIPIKKNLLENYE